MLQLKIIVTSIGHLHNVRQHASNTILIVFDYTTGLFGVVAFSLSHKKRFNVFDNIYLSVYPNELDVHV